MSIYAALIDIYNAKHKKIYFFLFLQTNLHFPYNGGLFKVTLELLAFVLTWPNDVLYIEDTYQNPIEIDKQEFLAIAQQHYQTVMNTWHQQHAELKRIRKI